MQRKKGLGKLVSLGESEPVELVLTEYKFHNPPRPIKLPDDFVWPKPVTLIGHMVDQDSTTFTVKIDGELKEG